MSIELLREVLAWSALINLGILILWLGIFIYAHDWVYRLHGKWFCLTLEKFDAIHYAAIAFYKLSILLFMLVPLFGYSYCFIGMKIWVDADACPVAIKEILFRAAERTGVELTLVANQALRKPPLANIKMLQVPAGFDVADNEIVKRVEPQDLVITADIPLAAEVLAKQARALNPRGELYALDSIKAKLSTRDFMDTLRGSGIQTEGPPALSQRDRQAFANQLDKILTRQVSNPQ